MSQLSHADVKKLVSDCNSMFGLVHGNARHIKAQKQQMVEELLELRDAVFVTSNKTEVADAIGDIGFVDLSLALLGTNAYRIPLMLYSQLGYSTPQDVLQCVAIAAKSNLTKSDTSEKDALATQAHYASLGVPTKISRVLLKGTKEIVYINKAEQDATDNAGKFYHEGKFLKSIVRYKEPDFSHVGAKLTQFPESEEDKEALMELIRKQVHFIDPANKSIR